MRRRLRQLAGGRFDFTLPNASFSVDKIDIQVKEGTDHQDEFEMISQSEIPVRGIVYSSNPRMECLTPQFDGEKVRIRYQFHSEDLIEGDIQRGCFTIVCSQKEYSLPFCVTIGKEYPEADFGQLRTLDDFVRLAREKWQEAYRIFYSSAFASLLQKDDEKLLYRAYERALPCDRNMEEFLIGAGKKLPVRFGVSHLQFQIQDIEEEQQEKIEIHKEEWGYTQIYVETDADFLSLDRERITTEDFIGNTLLFPITIRPEYLHAGKNYGSVVFKSNLQISRITFEVSGRKKGDLELRKKRRETKEGKCRIAQLYLDYRFKRMVTGVWANESVQILDHLYALNPEKPLYLLMKAQAFIINKQKQEAEWILSQFKRQNSDHRSPVWGYYLYLLTLMQREPSFVDKMTREIEDIFRENEDSALLFWILTFLREEYCNNPSNKLKAILYWIEKGNASPYLYLEAYYLYQQDPYLLHRLNRTEIKIMRWAIRHEALTKELAEQIFELFPWNDGFDKVIFSLMEAAYQSVPKEAYIEKICSYLIKGQRFETVYHNWYERGIELNLRLTGLYEAFLLSMDEEELVKIPRIIQMYFQYDSALPYKKLAVLYRNIIAAKEKEPEVYQKYRRSMARFALEQLELRHIDDDLSVLYEDMIGLGFINTDIAIALSKIVFTNKLIVKNVDAVRAYIYHEQLEKPQIVPIVNGSAYCSLYGNAYRIVLEDVNGYRIADTDCYRTEALMQPDKYMQKCRVAAPEDLAYLVYYFGKHPQYGEWNENDEGYFATILSSKELSSIFRKKMFPEIIHYCRVNGKETQLASFFKTSGISEYRGENKRLLLELLIKEHMYDLACEAMGRYGMDQLGSAQRVSLAGYLIEKYEYEKEDVLLDLSYMAFQADKYSETVLDYLSRYYFGPEKTMIGIWEKARQYEVLVRDLEERILTQVLYAGNVTEQSDQVFFDYEKNGATELIELAYLSYRAYEYFTEGKKTEAPVFQGIENRYLADPELNDACKLALLKYYAESGQANRAELEIEDQLLGEYIKRNMCFAFFRKLDKSLIMKYHLYDKVILEYRAPKGTHVVLHYSRDEDGEDFITEDMPEIFDGIYTKSFIMFFGEMIQYYISEEEGKQIKVSENSRITNNEVYSENDLSRYNLINQMIISNTLQENSALFKDMKEYKILSKTVKQLLTVL